jgi:hypothetical protein
MIWTGLVSRLKWCFLNLGGSGLDMGFRAYGLASIAPFQHRDIPGHGFWFDKRAWSR